MATKMAETKITLNVSGNQTLHSNPAVLPLPVSAGVPVTAATKIAGNPNGSVHGQVTGTTIIHNNPA